MLNSKLNSKEYVHSTSQMARWARFGTFMRALGLIVGCLATGMAYSMDAFTTYADALKDLFQYNQSQSEYMDKPQKQATNRYTQYICPTLDSHNELSLCLWMLSLQF